MLPSSLNIWPFDSDHRACIISVFRLQLNDRGSLWLHLCDPCVNLCVCSLGWIKVGEKFEKVFTARHTWKQDVSQILPIFKIWEISPEVLLTWLTTVGKFCSGQMYCINAKRAQSSSGPSVTITVNRQLRQSSDSGWIFKSTRVA